MVLPSSTLYGIQTARALNNFPITDVPISHFPELVVALAMVKKACARANRDLGALESDHAVPIIEACDEIIGGKHHEYFVVDMIQGGAGTSTNMNANELIANVALRNLGHEPCNHDRRETMRDGLAAAYPYLRQAEDFLHYVVEDFPVRLIGLDTVVPGKVGGAICAARAAWFADRLAEGDGRPTLVFMHHPPFVTGVSGMDATMCRTDSAFAGLVESHPEIECVVAGHHHRPITRRWAGTVGFVVPGVAHQLALDLRPGQPIRFILEPPGFALHAWSPETGLVSHVAPIGDYGPSRDF